MRFEKKIFVAFQNACIYTRNGFMQQNIDPLLGNFCVL